MGWIKKLFLSHRQISKKENYIIEVIEGLIAFGIIVGLFITLILTQIEFWKYKSMTVEEIAKEVIKCPSATNESLIWAYRELGYNKTTILPLSFVISAW